jgi:hypothetical protein
VSKILEDMQQHGVTEESNSPWLSPIILVQKNRDLCFCADYKKLNDVIREDCFPLPQTDDTLDTLAEAKWFSILDLKCGSWQVALHSDNKEKIVFSTGQEL